MTTSLPVSFTSAVAGDVLQAAADDVLNYSLSGTFSATMVLERSTTSGRSWSNVLTLTAAGSGAFPIPRNRAGGKSWYRWRCDAFTSGTAVTNLITGYQTDMAPSIFKSVDITVTAAQLDGAGSSTVVSGLFGGQYKVRNITLVGGGTNFDSGGDRLIDLTDGTTVWTTIANADIESVPAASLPWGNAKVPMLTGKSNIASVANADIVFKYSGGTTDHGGVGSLTFNVLLEKVA